ncbi:hypothetical protein LR948_02000 [Roseivivax sp. GX 12232]|uniref:hypothetical protein n=1 Tax=Roseivivax sp. GX 12232 TaxID=2900547 RepID=UPI001E316009|nr:hypothetical protein [Roseivivax sp. GX 12232]MCE0504120.1 hypothetical protein [Roseivivax sp. GX 12232]
MSDMLSHWAIFEDARNIAVQDDKFDPELSRVIETYLEYARLGTVSRGGNQWMGPIIKRARAAWGEAEAHPAQDRKLAYALGGLPHQAIDNVIKPYRNMVVRRDEAHERPLEAANRWLYAYHDAFVLKKVFGGGEDGAFFNKFLLAANPTSTGQAIEDYARTMVLRGLQGLHTLSPNIEDMDGWLDRSVDFIQPVTIDIARLVEGYVDPDPDKMQRFRIEEEFYREDDPAIQLAEAVRSGAQVEQGRIDEVAAGAEANQSVYGQALAIAIRYMREGAKLWRGETEELDTPNYDTAPFWAEQAAKGQVRKQDVSAAKATG